MTAGVGVALERQQVTLARRSTDVNGVAVGTHAVTPPHAADLELHEVGPSRMNARAGQLLIIDREARELAAAKLESSESPGTDADTLGVELERVVGEAIAALPARCREVFELSRVQGMRYVEIASVLEISVKTVEKRMGQALAELRERLAPWLGGGRGNPV